ncbi:MAG: SusC/RagA family TonB-linked outer membrane protein [Bacteroidetes bacterium]|nr:SusC/RagA family TonB-linked outer membrane protein [Bacteroidota bacterium]
MYVKHLKTGRYIKTVLSVCTLFLAFGVLCAQNIKITGVVVDNNGEPVVGATVLVKGTRTISVASLDGSFSIDAPINATLSFTAIGYLSQDIPVRNRTKIDVIMVEDAVALEGVMVTAEFGLKRAARSVGSAIQSVKAADIAESGRTDFVTALQGRIAGLNVTTTSGAPGASTTVILRNYTSISGNNQPLYVVDGVPMNNSTFDAAYGLAKDDLTDSRRIDFSSRGNDLNPEDIESMTVLKGAAAAALYGSDASNGAIIITTKKGSATAGKGIVRYNNTFGWSQSYGFPEVQKVYANGNYGTTNYYNTSRFGGKYPADVTLYDNVAAGMQTGFLQQHNVSVESGNDKASVRASAGYSNDKGTVKQTNNSRFNISLSGKAEINKWLSFESSMSYISTQTQKQLKGQYGLLYRGIRWPLTDDMSNYMDPDGKMRVPELYTDTDLLNPLYGMYKNRYYDESDRFFARVSARITPVKHTFVVATMGWDIGLQTFNVNEHPYYGNRASTSSYGLGMYNQVKADFKDKTMDIVAGYQNSWHEFSLSAQAGYHQVEQGVYNMAIYGSKFAVIEFYGIQNCDPNTVTSRTTTTMRRVQGLSGQIELGYHDMAFVTLRARNDWSSTLPVKNNSFFYPAIEGSFIATELPFLQKKATLSYLKLRGAIAQVGKDARPLSIYPAFEPTEMIGGGFRYGYTGPNESLKPEMNTTYEIGFESRFFDNRINVDFTHYWTKCDDQYITNFRLSYATGFVLNDMNVGSFTTHGWDVHIDGDLIRAANGLRWNVGLNVSRAKSKVVYLPENVTEYYNAYTWLSGNIRNGVQLGYPLTAITGQAFERNNKGDILINPSNGIPVTSTVWSYLGDREPEFRFGFTTQLAYKGFRLSALLSGNIGATIVNGTKRDMMGTGSSLESVALRENPPMVIPGVLKNGLENSDHPTVNNIVIDNSIFGSTIYTGGDEDWLEKNVHYMRLSELRLNYTIPSRWLSGATRNLLSAANVWVATNDLFVLTNYSGIDAVGNITSASAGGTGGAGFDYWGLPAPRRFSVGISLTF